MSAPVVVLVGPPGSGKTTVGRALADALGVDFRDTDADVETAAGRPIRDIFIDQGESWFRERERGAVEAALSTHPGVLALGGGAVLDPATRERLQPHRVVFLDVGLADAAQRIGMGVTRPLLLGNVRNQLKTLLDARRPLYEAVATHLVDTAGHDADEVCLQVLRLLVNAQGGTLT